MTIAITPAMLDDAAALADIAATVFPLSCPPDTATADLHAYIDTELTTARFRQHLTDPSKLVLTAREAGAMVGYLMLSQSTAPAAVRSARPIELQRLYVLPSFHGMGVAGALIAQALVVARTMQRDTLWLSVSQLNPRGLAFYAKQGFHKVGEQQFLVGQDPQDDDILVLPVTAAPALSH